MKKMFGLVVALLILYIAFQAIYSYVVGRQTNSYSISVGSDEYKITETYTSRHKSTNHSENDKTNYYYEITSNQKLLFSFKLVGNYTGIKEFLEKLMIYKSDNLICAYPIFKDKTPDMDVSCNSGDKYYLYAALKGQDAGLDAFVESLKTLGYKHPSWDAPKLEANKISGFDFYYNNIAENQNLVIWQYTGFYRITNRGNNFFALNTSDLYDPTLTGMINQYYVVPDYKDRHSYTRVFVTNLISGSMETIDLGVAISYDSFIQGTADNKIYVIDRSNKIQYAVDIYNKEAKVTGDVNNETKCFINGKWESKSIYDVVDNNIIFSDELNIPDNLKAYNPLYVDSIGGDTDGYYYLYVKEGTGVSVYRVDKQNSAVLTMIFKTPSVSSIKYTLGDINFISGDTLYTYRDNLGLRPLVKYSEFIFNKSNLYNIYVND